jgi:GTP cyclohydrolase I
MTHKDIQSQKDLRNIEIEKVGVKNIKYPIIVEDRENKLQNTVADIDIFVDLPHDHRGTHMSRFLEVLNSYHKENLIDNLEPLLKEVKKQLNSETAYIKIKFPYFVQKTAPVSMLTSLLDYSCVFEASLADIFEFKLGVTVPVTTLCPCSKEISDFGAHNQRSYVTVKVIYNTFIWIEELIDYVEKTASCEIYPLLKRPDEKYVTEKAYQNPVFVEDIVREVTLILKKDKRIDWFSVESENIESIHNHNAYAYVES